MTTIELRFPASRYHATPWGRHVNEGVPEWPPSPYRLLRGLFDVWQRKRRDLTSDAVEPVLRALAESLPWFVLPSATASHTRSYLRSDQLDVTDKSLVFDAFLAFVPKTACYVTWPNLTLNRAQQDTLTALLTDLNYLGRSESWVEARLYEGQPEGDWQCAPVEQANYGGEVTRVACVVSASTYKGKEPWLQALTESTSETLRARRSAPLLLREAPYVRPEHCIQTDPPAHRVRPEPQVQAVLFGLDSPVLPLMTATIEVAEQIRVRLMGAHRRIMNDDPSRVSPLFSGKALDGQKAHGHGHLFVLPLGNDLGRIDRVLLISRHRTLTRDEMRAVQGVRELWQANDRPTVQCVVAWQGVIHADGGPKARRGSPLFAHATSVESVTPFVTARHWKRRQDLENFLVEEVRRECHNHNIPSPVQVQRCSRIQGLFDAVEFRRNRKDDPPRAGYAFRLVFEEPVTTPFTLGYGCHFGLGQFAPA